TGPESLPIESKPEVTDLEKELLEKISELEKKNLSNEQEIKALRHSLLEFETQISNLKNEKEQLEQTLEVTLRDSAMTSKCMVDLQNEITVLNADLDSQVSAKDVLMGKLSELESGKHDLEVHLSDLEKENVQVSERICGLE